MQYGNKLVARCALEKDGCLLAPSRHNVNSGLLATLCVDLNLKNARIRKKKRYVKAESGLIETCIQQVASNTCSLAQVVTILPIAI